jgi:hypothetical protein
VKIASQNKDILNMQKLYKRVLRGLKIFTVVTILLVGYSLLTGDDPFNILLLLVFVLSPFLIARHIDKATKHNYVLINMKAVSFAFGSLILRPLVLPVYFLSPAALLLSIVGIIRFVQHKNKNGKKENYRVIELFNALPMLISSGVMYYQICTPNNTSWH